MSQNETLVELHARGADGAWRQYYFTELEEMIELPRFDLRFPVSALYARLSGPPPV